MTLPPMPELQVPATNQQDVFDEDGGREDDMMSRRWVSGDSASGGVSNNDMVVFKKDVCSQVKVATVKVGWPVLKFLTSEMQIELPMDGNMFFTNNILGKILTHLNLTHYDIDERRMFWRVYSNVVAKKLGAERNTAAVQCKRMIEEGMIFL